MASGYFTFDAFTLDSGDRQLLRDDRPVDLNARYFDALLLLVRERGRLVTKDRFHAEIWRGIPVTDEALTQCIRTLRRQLGDDAARPRFIETVPKHGYRFIADVAADAGMVAAPAPRSPEPPAPAESPWLTAPARRFLLLGGAGMLGGALAGAIGGILYGFAAASRLDGGAGGLSLLLVILIATIMVALIGGAGVAFGIAAGGIARDGLPRWAVLGGALGGLWIGAVVKLLGMDTFNLLLGRAPADMTGAGEGLILGAATGLAFWLAQVRGWSLRRAMAGAALIGLVASALVIAAGGHLMAGSIDLLARGLPESHIRLDAIGAMFGERGIGPLAGLATAALEAGLFVTSVSAALLAAHRTLPPAVRKA
ncbi:transcriptional regulator [Sphingomonas sp.]|uniref:winged helix-turn-helix domain-containing protein n=1 Tax=Sphingomonas sp. TaxID=28214 RepID=UPI001EBE3FBC|nr:transcriptional regulator [Sphingomonas sp.]MBX3593081.1 transcriptional regulator [Sphingomonas sp.]